MMVLAALMMKGSRPRRTLVFLATAWAIVSVITVATPVIAVDNPPPPNPELKGRDDAARPAAVVESRRVHYIGQVWATVSNDGRFGSDHGGLYLDPVDRALLKLSYTPSFEFPGGSRLDYLFTGSLWIGGLVGNDTLVSLGHEGWAGAGTELLGFEPMIETLPPGYTPLGCNPLKESDWENLGLREKGLAQIRSCVYYDTLVLPNSGDPEPPRLHLPMGLEVTQITHQGSDTYSQRFVIVDCAIKNISDHPVEKMWLGVFMDNDIWQTQGIGDATDDISGFIHTWPNPTSPTYLDTLDMSWAADNDADPQSGQYQRSSCVGAMGVRILRAPAGTRRTFNWWTSDGSAQYDWGPRRLTDLRGLGHGGNGTPSSDRAKYHYMSNDEIDYGQLFSAVDYTAEGWKPPPARVFACDLADGRDTRSVLAVGPIPALNPGETIPFTYALIAGDSLHQDPGKRFDCSNPGAYYASLHFGDLTRNAWWAGFVFDNFGVDTDHDGYRGEAFVDSVSGDSIFYTGDGCPDFSGPSSPPCPEVDLASRPKELTIRWSGAATEVAVDAQTLEQDFEGYKVYYAERNSKDDIPTTDDYSLLASWDRVDYRRYTWSPVALQWTPSSTPLTVEQWREEFNDPTFDPEAHRAPSFESCYHYSDPQAPGVDLCAYFVPQDYNMGNEYVVSGDTVKNLIQRVAEKTNDLGQTYGEYEVVLSNLLPAKHYFVTVTAFDYGDPAKSLPPLETAPGQCRDDGIPIYSADVVQDYWESGGSKRDSVNVVVYPNPYKITYVGPNGRRTSYFEQGYEGKVSDTALDERDRRIHFINLPDTATISIYTLDGDLVRTLEHPDRNLSGYTSEISWDLVSRNTQAVASGIYIYRVDSRLGSQVGKIVIIK